MTRWALDTEDGKFYNVLCIAVEGGIAYRRGLGIVSRRHWTGIGAKVETVNLG
jgi:hypothetical protein